jgi:hypothetical protein
MSSAAAFVDLKRNVACMSMISTTDQRIASYGCCKSSLTALYNTLSSILARKLAGHNINSTIIEDAYLAGTNAFNMASSLPRVGAMEDEVIDQPFMRAGASLAPITVRGAVQFDPGGMKLATNIKVLVYRKAANSSAWKMLPSYLAIADKPPLPVFLLYIKEPWQVRLGGRDVASR